MSKKQGNLSINSTNIFPIIKKWMYSDQDIFIRELISNASDAITKLKKLDMIGEYEIPEDKEMKATVSLNSTDKTITFTDTGLGMTADEVEEYINQIAFSGATDFIEKYKDKATDDQIIGHFGLGFYSAFMVADKVTIDTLSYKADAKAVHWECDGGTEYVMSDSDKTDIGTKITLYLNDQCYEYSNEYRVREVLDKYCSFMPISIYLTVDGKEDETEIIDEEELLDSDTVIEHIVPEKEGDKKTVKIKKRPQPINDTNPLWNKHPNECTEEQYKDFYHKVFNDYRDPLFYIHLNMDYPFNLKGILYFPKINLGYEALEGKIKLYNNQVFIADNIKEVIPEYLILLKGVIDCPDLPLNVSRSALQNDGFVKKINEYISKKIADKLIGMYKTDTDNYKKYWDDINMFIKFGCIKDNKFAEKMKDYILYKNLKGEYVTAKEYLDSQNGKFKNTIFYISDETNQGHYINMFKEEGIDAVYMTETIDDAFISYIENDLNTKTASDDNADKDDEIKFRSIDSDIASIMKGENSDSEASSSIDKDALIKVFKENLSDEKLDIQVEGLKNPSISAMITVSEEKKRMNSMMRQYAVAMNTDMGLSDETGSLVLNSNNELIKYIANNKDSEDIKLLCQQIYDIACLAHAPLSADRMTSFISRNNDMLTRLIK